MPNPNVMGGNGYTMNAQQTPVNQQFMQQNNPPLTPTSYTLIIVNRYEEAANAWVPPGYTTIFVNFNDSQMYVKKNEPNGIPSQMRIFDFTERIQQPTQPNQNGVSREEFEDFKNTLLAAITQAQQVPQAPRELDDPPVQKNQKNGYSKGGRR